jgi:hypothetical protein
MPARSYRFGVITFESIDAVESSGPICRPAWLRAARLPAGRLLLAAGQRGLRQGPSTTTFLFTVSGSGRPGARAQATGRGNCRHHRERVRINRAAPSTTSSEPTTTPSTAVTTGDDRGDDRSGGPVVELRRRVGRPADRGRRSGAPPRWPEGSVAGTLWWVRRHRRT